ncbi:MAG TPA: CPBP family intramembrane glutamic endopeptidase [Patescibacteria group bacterium]|nr:CPBP family intramembrane glutamic endopeptidase [Patescibacteria group bacterium]
MIQKKVTLLKAALIFLAGALYFFLLLFTLLPFLKSNFSVNPALYWFGTGYFLFVPIFVSALMMAKAEGNQGTKQILSALHIRPFTKKEWKYSLGGLLLGFVLSGAVFGVSLLLNKYFAIRMLSTTPWFMEMRPFQGAEKLLLLGWLPMFFFNITGEEILWRGYIQARMQGRYLWLLCSLLWMLFHLPFGADLMIMLVPVIIIIPYAFHKTKNTQVGMFIHGMFNGPMFVAVALGWIK